MKRFLALCALVVLFVAASGCTTPYKVAMDERSIGSWADDEVIEGTILKDFVKDDTVKSLDISTYSYEGRVYLVGEYDSPAQKSRAVAIAKSVKGVKSVTSYLLPKPKSDFCGTTDNLSILARVKKGLIAADDVHSTNVDVKVVQCRVVLLGIVASRAEAERAAAVARGVEGTRGVTSYLRTK
jgi:hyperosmotically inducible periplasmic protein